MTTLLPFQKTIIEEFHSPASSELLILARGLGLRKILCTLLKIYNAPQSLILLLGATTEEEASIGEELGVMGVRQPGLRVVDYEMGRKERADLYKGGGLISVTSRILVMDMLQKDIPVELITGLVILHAERVSETSTESFIIRLYRQDNQDGFLKAFSDDPEHFTYGFAPLRSVMKQLRISTVRLYPRFHEMVQSSLSKRTADVVELYQPLSESMKEIHQCIRECMEATLSEIKRSHSSLDLDEVTVENAYFRSFDFIIRRQLDPVWFKAGPRTNGLLSDMAELRRLNLYLLSYPPITFLKYLESIIASNTVTEKGNAKQNHSPWLYMDAASTMIKAAKARCFTIKSKVTQEAEHDEEFDVLHEWEGGRKAERKTWLPKDMEPVFEELPKWDLLRKVLQEIEEAVTTKPFPPNAPGSNRILIMVNDTKTCAILREYLTSLDPEEHRKHPDEPSGAKMLEDHLKDYIFWKGRGLKNAIAAKAEIGKGKFQEKPKDGDGEISEALRMKDKRREQAILHRRRMRGGKAPEPVGRKNLKGGAAAEEPLIEEEANRFGKFIEETNASPPPEDLLTTMSTEDIVALTESIDSEFDTSYGLIPDDQTIIIREYGDDSDDMLLAELKPRWIVMYEPDQAFIRRVEVYKSSNPGLAVRVYFMVYHLTGEDFVYIAAQRKEKDAFTKLIEERGTMLNPILEAPTRTGSGDLIKAISTRMAGGGKVANAEPIQVIVDAREFRSSLPSLLHAANIKIVPATLTVGDYVLTPDMVVERKSPADLIQSFNSGRLYTQCEMMSVHYKQPILLIEFDEDKSFGFQSLADARNYAKPAKPIVQSSDNSVVDQNSVQAKLVLLTLAFPRLRIIWSPSPFATAKTFPDLKTNHPEPDVSRALAIGAEDGTAPLGDGWNATAEDLLQAFPGISSKNVRYVMGKVNSVRELCHLNLAELESLLGTEGGKACYQFLQRGRRKGKEKT